ncbi:uncharacterized protein LOC126641811 [Myiozetetes cayanensis]|uniref:uncharacterized protein LOC126641811 n=1 Tax=Myiozetetes cayanensis TaxID=478635 RepID=UPI00215EC8F7|nr:uncharacterized protein LOC126641811 [Myiozetetes cayanensis]
MALLLGIVLSLMVNGCAIEDINPRENMWVTWANHSGVTDFCLALQQAGDPFRTCLIGYPYIHWPDFNYLGVNYTRINQSYWEWRNINSDGECIKSWDWPLVQNAFFLHGLVAALNATLSHPPEELDLWGSFPPISSESWQNITTHPNCSNIVPQILPVNGSGTIKFGEEYARRLCGSSDTCLYTGYFNVSGNTQHWNVSRNVGGRDYNVTTSRQLPSGYFLICGDRVWPGIPAKIVGGPCYIGKLTLFAPSMRHIMTIHNQTRRAQRSLHDLKPDCNDNVNIGTLGGTVALATFLPGGAVAANWKKIRTLACWAVKQFNSTSDILTGLATDVEDLRHAVLQNRAAIDFLLLAQGHGCTEFEGMCCMNLSDHSVSIHKQLEQLRERIHHVKEGSSAFDDWLSSLGISGWLKDVLRQGLTVLVVGVLILLLLPCCITCARISINRSINAVFKKRGGSVGAFAILNQYTEL